MDRRGREVPGLQRLGVPKQDAQDESQAVRLDETDAGIGGACATTRATGPSPKKIPRTSLRNPPVEAASRKMALARSNSRLK